MSLSPSLCGPWEILLLSDLPLVGKLLSTHAQFVWVLLHLFVEHPAKKMGFYSHMLCTVCILLHFSFFCRRTSCEKWKTHHLIVSSFLLSWDAWSWKIGFYHHMLWGIELPEFGRLVSAVTCWWYRSAWNWKIVFLWRWEEHLKVEDHKPRFFHSCLSKCLLFVWKCVWNQIGYPQ